MRFSLRTLFVLVTLLCAWLGYQLNWIRERRAALQNPMVHSFLYDGDETPRAPGLLWLLGERGYGSLEIGDDPESGRVMEAGEMKRLEELFPEASIGWDANG